MPVKNSIKKIFAAITLLLTINLSFSFLLFSIGEVFAQNKKAPPPIKPEANAPGVTDSPSQQDEPVRLRSDLVVVSVTITDALGKYVHSLKGKDFIVSEDNVPQSINSFAAEEAPFAAAILVDMSGSMGYKFGLVRAAAASFVENIRENDQVAVYGFNNKVKQMQDFSNVRDITDYIWDAEAKETTKLYDCLNEALDALAARPEKRRAILLISDGCDTSSQKSSMDSVLKKALSIGANIYCVDLIDSSEINSTGSGALDMLRGRNEMKEFANQTGAQYINSPKGDNLDTVFANIIEELRNQYTLTYFSTNEKRDGKWRKLDVSIANSKLAVRSRRGYYAAKK
jgi:Ca-activated chloride channel family protein